MDHIRIYRDSVSSATWQIGGLLLLCFWIAAACRVPSLLVTSPVSWLTGSFSIGYVVVFGPVIILLAAAYAYLTINWLTHLRNAVLEDLKASGNPSKSDLLLLSYPLIGIRSVDQTETTRFPRALTAFTFGLFILAFSVTLTTYFDFKTPGSDCDSRSCRFFELTFTATGWEQRPRHPQVEAALGRLAESDPDKAQAVNWAVANPPYIYAPLQTWSYLLALALLFWMAQRLWSQDCGVAVAGHDKNRSLPADADVRSADDGDRTGS